MYITCTASSSFYQSIDHKKLMNTTQKQKCQREYCNQDATEVLTMNFERAVKGDVIVSFIKTMLCQSCSVHVRHADFVDMKRNKLKNIMNLNSKSAIIDVHTDKNRLTSLNEMGLNGKIQGEIQLDEPKEILRIIIKPK